ncbi:MAG: 1-acyl-sn-glycerol-3-phosphate acyltransferase [Zhongshania sp.]|uniref:1-acyl-sn-glycerol-3-phosphate acyltransferase n=1 Tax=Zhongshania sp. TaxID=1971902 RepID=UPI0026081E2A|nr:1-acyl-sn-glycerol-3-phosphate acyltransferase [Zhongshania sp.]MDF1692430.1 1-acyl-sn-glycerol-3-phosphate acyltransferase [Zhongshania sp.]
MDTFAEIRPYHDDEVAPVLAKLLVDPEMLNIIASLRLPRLNKALPWLVRPLVRWYLAREMKGIANVGDFQWVVKGYMDAMIEGHTTSFQVSGLEKLDSEQAYLYISNHRDIALDPAFVNYALYHHERDTVRIAIGDNLLSKPFAADLMRLNKSFVVRRSARGPRQMLAAFRQLASYIRFSLLEERSSIWIAQREGRAKDGNDATEAAVIKMIGMAQNKPDESFSDYVNKLNIVPVSISYEWDPLDAAKAQELVHIERDGAYQKAEHEDLKSIATGIVGNKGHVHVAFGAPLKGEFSDAVAVAAKLDEVIIDQYRLHPSNIIAYMRVVQNDNWKALPMLPEITAADIEVFDKRFSQMPADYRNKAMEIYANPVINQLDSADLRIVEEAI